MKPEPSPEQLTPQARQSSDQSTSSETEWNVYLHHPRGTVERIAGPFLDEEQARSEMSSQMAFGLFPESKGYRVECKEETKGSEVEDPDDEPDEILHDFLEPEPSTPQPSTAPRTEQWLTTGEAYKKLANQGFKKSLGTFRRWLKDAITTEELPSNLQRLGLIADFEARKQASPDNSVRWLRSLPGNSGNEEIG